MAPNNCCHVGIKAHYEWISNFLEEVGSSDRSLWIRVIKGCFLEEVNLEGDQERWVDGREIQGHSREKNVISNCFKYASVKSYPNVTF